MTSDAVGSNRVSSVVGYVIEKGDFQTVTPDLPQRIAIVGEANTANQSGLSLDPVVLTTSQQAGELYGFGSPLHISSRILLPVYGGGVDGIPVVAYPVAEASGATNEVLEIVVTGTPTANATHTVKINGRTGVDGSFYDFSLVTTDTVITAIAKIKDAVNGVLGSPVIATDDGVDTVTLTSKWKGVSAAQVNAVVLNNDADVGVTYAVTEATVGSGVESITPALTLFGSEWNTIVVNTWDLSNTTVLSAMETVNGKPDPTAPTGRYAGTVMKPFVAITGYTDATISNSTSITDARLNELTIATAPAPGSLGLSMEAAANMAVLQAVTSENTPHLDVLDLSYGDMPTADTSGDFDAYAERDAAVKLGLSTCVVEGGRYKIKDFVTTYHPIGEVPPQFRFVRNLMVDYNVRFGYYLLEEANVVGHVILANDDTPAASTEKVIKPRTWKSIVNGYADTLAQKALIADTDFMKDSIDVGLSTTNPDRLETTFSYKRSGVGRISATTATAGFNFGTL